MRTETEKRFEHLQIAERRFADRIRHVEEILAAVRTEIQPGPPPATDGERTNGRNGEPEIRSASDAEQG